MNDSRPFSFNRSEWLIIIAVALGYFVDAFDIIIFSVVKDTSFKSIGVEPSQMLEKGLYVLYFQLTGFVIGGLLFGKAGDTKLGRQNSLFLSILLYSIATFANSLVSDIYAYGFLRFVAGIGLGGEFVGIALLLERLSIKNRTIGMMFFATAGMLGAVTGGLAGVILINDWRTCYQIGAFLGVLLLFIRLKTTESQIFITAKNNENPNIFGSFSLIFSNKKTRDAYIFSILSGGSLFVCVGLFIQGTQTFSLQFGFNSANAVTAPWAVVCYYLGAAPAEIIATWLRRKYESSKKPMNIYYIFQIFTIIIFCFSFTKTKEEYYLKCWLLGFSLGYWALFLALSAEQFGTNIRATASTSIPNLARAMAIPYTLLVPYLKGKGFDFLWISGLIGVIAVLIAWYSANMLEETYTKDLNYLDK
jgi:MFS transporter, putative metabolite:H+ symporter